MISTVPLSICRLRSWLSRSFTRVRLPRKRLGHGEVEVELRPWPLRHYDHKMKFCQGGDGQHRGAFVVRWGPFCVARYCWRHLP